MADATRHSSYSRIERFLRNFYSLLQTTRIHRDNHKLVVDGVSNFSRFVSACFEGESLVIKIVNDRLVVDEEIIPYNRTTKNLVDNMVRYFGERSLEGLRLFEPIKHAPKKKIIVFMRLLDRSEHHPDSLTWLTNGLNSNNIFWVEVIKKPETPPPEKNEEFAFNGVMDFRERAQKDYTCIMAAFKEVAQKVEGMEAHAAGMRKVIRVIQGMVSHIIDDAEVYSAISTLRVFDDYTFTHSINVAILSMCMGKSINLSRRSLERLGICALFHDLGKIKVPYEILNKSGKLNKSDLKKIEEHSLNSARLIIKLKTTHDRKAKILLPPFEHHLKYDLSGYPYANWKKPLTLFGRIIAIADVYDAITSPRVYRRSIFSPDRALGLMLEGSGRDFDPILIKVFINMLGVYPVGTLLRLNTDELALVISTSPQKNATRPVVCLMHKDTLGNYFRGETLDLGLKYSDTDKYVWEIIETYHPSEFGIQPVQFMF